MTEAALKLRTDSETACKHLGPVCADLRPIDITKAVTRDYIARRGIQCSVAFAPGESVN